MWLWSETSNRVWCFWKESQPQSRKSYHDQIRSESYSIINNRSLSNLPIHKSQLFTCLSMNIIISFVRIMKFRASIICIGIFLFLIVDTNNTSLESNQPNQLFGTYTISVGNPISHKVPPSTSSSVVYVKKKYCSKVLCIIQNQSRNRLC